MEPLREVGAGEPGWGDRLELVPEYFAGDKVALERRRGSNKLRIVHSARRLN
jgi:hypothetical protein